MTSRRRFLALTTVLLPLPAAAQVPWGRVRERSGEVTLNDLPLSGQSALRAGQALRTGADGRVRFTLGSDAYFLRANSVLRLEASSALEPVVDLLRLVTGALGGTFARGMRRSLITPTATIGIRGTGVYLESSRDLTYACTCFGATQISSTPTGAMMESVAVSTENHQARFLHRESMMGMRIARAPFQNHTNEEMAGLEALAGRPNPFSS
jgi:hypothetical protein